MRHYDRVLAVSDYMGEAMEAAGIGRERIETVHDGVDLEEFTGRIAAAPDEVRRRLQIPPDRLVAVMVGHLRSWKGQDVVLRALRHLDKAVLDRLEVLFIGDAVPQASSYFDELKAIVAEAHLEERVRFLGARDDVPDLMNAADLVLHASTLPEPFGLVVVEGMALGKPVIASRLGGPSEIFTPGTGLCFDPERPEELARLLGELAGDPERRRAIGEAARQRVRTFAISETVAKVERIYREVLASKGGGWPEGA
jgi:glycosyltransferase involved in cell wall biosynthesis